MARAQTTEQREEIDMRLTEPDPTPRRRRKVVAGAEVADPGEMDAFRAAMAD